MIVNIAIGSNIDDPRGNVEAAMKRLSGLGRIIKHSSLYATSPWGVIDQPDFCNAVTQLDTDFSAQELLFAMQEIERAMGRTATYRWGPRLIDLDLLTYGDQRVDEPDLTVPHPRMNDRSFVLVPLAEIDNRFVGARNLLPRAELDGVKLLR